MVTRAKHSKNRIFQTGNIDHATVFASLSNSTRLRCLYLAARHDEVCVCEVVDALDIPQPTVSKAFKALKESGLVTDRRDSNWIYYRINESMPRWMTAVVDATVKDLARSGKYVDDEKQFERSRVQEETAC